MKLKRIMNRMALVVLGVAFICLSGCQKNPSDTVVNPTGENESTDNQGNKNGKKEKVYQGEPVFSVSSGFYDNTVKVELSTTMANARIFYTTDGSTPDSTSTEYTETINIAARTNSKNVLSAQKGINPDGDYIPDYKVDKGTVVRAITMFEDGTFSPESTATYFVGLDESKYEGVKIVSLATDFSNLFDYETGIYVLGKTYEEWLKEDPGNAYLGGWQKKGNFSNKGKEWERYASFELIDTDRTQGFTQNVGIRIMGAASRTGSQKSFRIVTREEYGTKNVWYDLIPGNERSDGTGEVEKYRSFVLRIGGNDRDYSRFRDPYLQSLVANRNFDTYQTTTAVVFLNGEYWGMYTITEDYSKHYLENNYGVDDDNVVYIKRGQIEDGEEEDIELFYEMFDFIYYNDMSDADNYAKACEYIDMDSLIDSIALNFYIYNQDDMFHGDNNWAMWRVRDPEEGNEYADGKFRMLIYDLDYSTGIYDGGGNYADNNIRESLTNRKLKNYEDADMADLVLCLLENEEFKQKLITVMCDMRNVEFEVGRAWDVLAQFKTEYEKYMPDTILRFGPFWAVMDAKGYYSGKVMELRGFMNGRYLKYPDLIKRAFGLDNYVTVEVSVNSAEAGTVKVNTSTIDSTKKFSGYYFTEYPVTITAKPVDGHKLAEWEYDGCEIISVSEDTITFKLTGNASIKAVFE